MALSFERFRFDNYSIYRRPDVLAHSRQMQVSQMLACDQQGLSMDFHHRGGPEASDNVHISHYRWDGLEAVTPADGWLTHDEDTMADVRDGHRHFAVSLHHITRVRLAAGSRLFCLPYVLVGPPCGVVPQLHEALEFN